MRVWRLDLKLQVEDTPSIRPWLERFGSGYCAHDLQPGDYERIRDWLRSDDLKGNRQVTKERYFDREYGRDVLDLTILFDNYHDANQFEQRWCDNHRLASTMDTIIITVI